MADELISRQTAKLAVMRAGCIGNILPLLDAEPAVDAVEVVHGQWENVQYNPVWRKMEATCSSCGDRGEIRYVGNQCGFVVPASAHCPNCGAKMDGERSGDDAAD